MKICPRCQKTYADDSLNFCLDDGMVLNAVQGTPAETVQMNQPRSTSPQSHMSGQPGTQPGWNNPQPMQPVKKSSKTWVWILLILGSFVLLCGGGLIGLLAYISSQTVNANRGVANSKAKNLIPGNTVNTNSSASRRDDMTDVDLQIFVKDFSAYGTTVLDGEELTMGSKQKGFYYVLVAPDDYQTEDADTRVTVRNPDNESGSLGYGLIFHSDPTPLQQGYAFLIDANRKKYRVVSHTPKKEVTVVPWTTSDAIKEGTSENTLEVRDLDDKIELYINGTMVKSIRNEHGYPGGVAGLYSGDGVKVAFSKLQILK